MPKSDNGFMHWRASDENGSAGQKMEDPFAPEKVTFSQRLEDVMESVTRFFRSRTGKIVTGVVCCVLALVIGGTVAYKSLVKPPELPTPDGQGGTPQVTPSGDKTPDSDQNSTEPAGPTDDELYPDDGYEGDMPSVSGERKEGEYTFLLVGTDQDDGNTDTIMVVNYNTVEQTVDVMSIPRDTMINESWDIKKINSVYSRTGNNINSLANRVKKLIGFKPDYYVKVELSMFVQLVDLVGGVEFYVPRDMDYDDDWQDLHIHLKEGQQILDGAKAMQLVRFRGYSDGDIGRVQVQQDFIKALIKECLSLKHWGKIKAYIDLALDNVQTDLDFGSIVWFAANVMGLNDAPMLDMANVNTHTLPGNYYAKAWSRATNQEQSYVTIYPRETVKLVNEKFNPYVQKVSTDMLDAMSILGNGNIASSTGTVKDTQHNEVMAVRRGEAYYDAEGNIVYGDPNGETTGDPTLPGEGDPATGNDPSAGTPDGGEGDDNEIPDWLRPSDGSGSGEEDTPETPEPVAPPEEEEDDNEIPGWLIPPEGSGSGEANNTDTSEPVAPPEEDDNEIPGWLLP